MKGNPTGLGRSMAWPAAFVILFAIAIPWYWQLLGMPPDARAGGMPAWFVVAVLGSLAISALVAWKLRTPWPEEQHAKDEPET